MGGWGPVSVIDVATRQVVETIAFEIKGISADRIQPVGIALTEDGATAFVALGPANRVAVVDAKTYDVQKYLPVGQRVWQLAFTPDQKTLIAPAFVYNYGFGKNWELVLEGQLETPLSPSGTSTFTEAGAFLKGVLRPGSLQDQPGPSVATEFGVLLPDSRGPGNTGASLAAIVSQRWDWGTVHLNVEGLWTRDQHAGAFTSVIVEGPAKWTVRPVAEISTVTSPTGTPIISAAVCAMMV